MDCTEFLDRYSEYDDSLVSPCEADRFRAHMAACEACARYDRVLRKGRMLARQLPGVEPSDDFVPRLRARLWREPGPAAPLPAPAIERAGQVASALAGLTTVLAVSAALVLLGRAEAAPPDARVAADRVHVLPPMERAEPRAWGVERVDREVASSYSHLSTGLPAYRRARPHAGASLSTYRTFD